MVIKHFLVAWIYSSTYKKRQKITDGKKNKENARSSAKD